MSEVVLDASAVLAFLGKERGEEIVRPHLRGGLISTVNAAEVINRQYRPGTSLEKIVSTLRSLEMRVVDFSFEQAVVAASLEPYAKAVNLSIADRACVSLGIMRGALVLTADDWTALNVGIDIRLIREKRPTS